MTKFADISAKSAEELSTLEGELRTELFKNRIKNHTNQLDSTAKLRGLRRDIARIKTALSQRASAETPAGKEPQS